MKSAVKLVKRVAKPHRAPRKKEESRLLAEIRLAILARPDIMGARINTGLYKAPHSEHRVRSAPTGFPDLVVTQLRRVLEHKRIETDFSLREWQEWHYYGQTVYIETKRPEGGRLSPEQINFAASARRVCAVYIDARSVDEVLEALGPVPEWVREVNRG